jgi:hypothetical protein
MGVLTFSQILPEERDQANTTDPIINCLERDRDMIESTFGRDARRKGWTTTCLPVLP